MVLEVWCVEASETVDNSCDLLVPPNDSNRDTRSSVQARQTKISEEAALSLVPWPGPALQVLSEHQLRQWLFAADGEQQVTTSRKFNSNHCYPVNCELA